MLFSKLPRLLIFRIIQSSIMKLYLVILKGHNCPLKDITHLDLDVYQEDFALEATLFKENIKDLISMVIRYMFVNDILLITKNPKCKVPKYHDPTNPIVINFDIESIIDRILYDYLLVITRESVWPKYSLKFIRRQNKREQKEKLKKEKIEINSQEGS
nr:hypothetical protein [Deltaproteobacteria bacterium]